MKSKLFYSNVVAFLPKKCTLSMSNSFGNWTIEEKSSFLDPFFRKSANFHCLMDGSEMSLLRFGESL